MSEAHAILVSLVVEILDDGYMVSTVPTLRISLGSTSESL